MNITILLVGVMNLLAFFMGAVIGQKAAKNEPITVPNPVKAMKKYKVEKETEKEQEQLEKIKYNIDNYTGDSTGQKDI